MPMTADLDNTIDLARTDIGAAYPRAQMLSDPGFRCQALAWVGWLAPDITTLLTAVADAEDAAWSADDPYQQVTAFAWPIRALIDRGWGKQAEGTLGKAHGLSTRIVNPVAKADALFLLWQAAFPLGAQRTQELRGSLIGACVMVKGRQGQHQLRDAALMLAAEDNAAASQIVSAMQNGRERHQAEKRIAEGEWMEPRVFFWRGPASLCVIQK